MKILCLNLVAQIAWFQSVCEQLDKHGTQHQVGANGKA